MRVENTGCKTGVLRLNLRREGDEETGERSNVWNMTPIRAVVD
ncbi:MAG: hypothetical protein R3293_29170 [Candidatus Promineifilaceae bacterium]|nr:hypothetical protein [Candidatus Promineifilaceae bacterium]